MKIIILCLFSIFLFHFNFLYSQDCDPQVHIDFYKNRTYKYSGKIVKKTFPIDFKNGQRKKITYQFRCEGKARCHFICDNKDYGNRGLIVKIRNIKKNGLKIPVTIIDEQDGYFGPVFWNIYALSNYEVEFSFDPKYIRSYCAGAVLFMYMKK